jgi:hypothetical protein
VHSIEIGSVSWTESISSLADPPALAPTSAHDVVTLQFTSGSTGSARAVPVTDKMQNDRFMSGGKFSVEFAFLPPVPSRFPHMEPHVPYIRVGVRHSTALLLSRHIRRGKGRSL